MNPQEGEAVAGEMKAVTKFTEEHAKEVRLPSVGAVNYMFSVAKMLVNSSLVSKDMGLSNDQLKRFRELGMSAEEILKREENAITANALGKMLVGFEMRIDPIQSLQEIDIVKAKIFVRYPQLIRQMEELRGFKIFEVERSDERAAIKIVRPDGREQEFQFTIEDAKRAGLTKRGGYNGDSPSQYELRPRVMLWARVISEAYRATGGKSGVYTQEERSEVLQTERDENGEFGIVKREAENPYHVGVIPDPPPPTQTTTPPPPPMASTATTTDSPKTTATVTVPPAATATDPPPPVSATVDAVATPVVATAEKAATPPPPASTAAPSNPKEDLKTKLDAICELIPQISPETLKKKHFLEFFRGFFNISKLTASDNPKIMAILPILRGIAKDSTGGLTQDPHGSGVKAGVGWRDLLKYLDENKFPDDCAQLARSIAVDRYADTGGGDLVEYLNDVAEAHKLSISDQRAFMQVLSVSREALRLKQIAEASGKSMQEIVIAWDPDLTKMKEPDIKARLDAEAAKVITKAPAEKVTAINTPKSAPAPAAVADDDDEEMSLFGLGE